MKSPINLLKSLKSTLLTSLILAGSNYAHALIKVTETGMSSDRVYQSTSKGTVVYVDNTGRLFKSQVDGSSRKNLSALSAEETELDRLVVIAKQASEFAVLENSSNSVVYFQARENPRSFRLFLYKVELSGNSAPQKLFQLVKPLKSMRVNAQESLIYLAGDDKHSLLNTGTDERQDLAIKAVPAAPFRVSNDFRWVAFVNEVRLQNRRTFELQILNLIDGNLRTLLQGLDRYDFLFEISEDSTSVAAQEVINGTERLVSVSMEGSDATQVYPMPGDTRMTRITDLRFIPGIRGEGDTGALIFSATNESYLKSLFIADLIDLAPRALDTREAQGESILNFRLSSDFKYLVFQRQDIQQESSALRQRTYSISLMDATARPVFLFENDFQFSEILKDSSAMLFVSNGGFYPRNQIIEVSLDGKSSRVLSANFPENWLTDGEQISRISNGPGQSVFLCTSNPRMSPAKFNLFSFDRN